MISWGLSFCCLCGPGLKVGNTTTPFFCPGFLLLCMSAHSLPKKGGGFNFGTPSHMGRLGCNTKAVFLLKQNFIKKTGFHIFNHFFCIQNRYLTILKPIVWVLLFLFPIATSSLESKILECNRFIKVSVFWFCRQHYPVNSLWTRVTSCVFFCSSTDCIFLNSTNILLIFLIVLSRGS